VIEAGRAAADVGAWSIAGMVPKRVVAPSSVAELAAAVADVVAAGEALVPLGRGAHRGLGHAPARYDVALVTAGLATIRDHQPADMTVTVEAGVTLAELDAVLARAHQWLPVDPALPADTTVGGLLGADLAGPLAASQGRVRDYVIGVTAVTADGVVTRAGGRVVKNVAGYDLMKLYVGSLGTLAVLAEATFKVRPRPAEQRCVVLAARGHAAALAFGAALDAERIGALAVTVAGAVERDDAGTIVVRLGGAAADVRAARERVRTLAARHDVDVVLEGDAADAAVRACLEAVRDFAAGDGDVVARLGALPTQVPAVVAAALAAAGESRGSWQADPLRGVTSFRLSCDAPAAALAALAGTADAHEARLVVERWPAALAEAVAVWHPLPPAAALMRRMKHALDPSGTLAPGRFVGRV
jgi:glycolate oxidase FAD binding subunit